VLIAEGIAVTLSALGVAALATLGTVATALFAIRREREGRQATWKGYKRGVYKRFLDSIDQVAKARKIDRGKLLARYRSRYHQTVLACNDSVLAHMKKLETDQPQLRDSGEEVDLSSPAVIALTQAMQRDVRPSGAVEHKEV
jgi:hypothetical protein